MRVYAIKRCLRWLGRDIARLVFDVPVNWRRRYRITCKFWELEQKRMRSKTG